MLEVPLWYVQTIIALVTITFFILVVISFKKRSVADLFIYIELTFRIVILFKPNSRSENSSASMYMLETWAIVFATYNGDRKSFFFAVVTLLVQAFVGVHYVYKNPLTPVAFVVNIFVLLNFVLISSIVFNTLHYVQKLHAKLQFTNQENQKLLQAMS